MVPHDHERVQPPPEPRARLEKTLPKRLRRTFGLEQILPVVPAIDDVVTRVREFQSDLAWHRRQHAEPRAICQESRHDPF